MPSDIFGTVQTMCGAYMGVYFLAHMTAVFAARYAGVDTNWAWLTRHDNSMLGSLQSPPDCALLGGTDRNCRSRCVWPESGPAAT
jgi:hypothetical protein